MSIFKAISSCVGSACQWAGDQFGRAVKSCVRTSARVPSAVTEPGGPKLTERTVSAEEGREGKHRRAPSTGLSGDAFMRPQDDVKGPAVGSGPVLSPHEAGRVVFHERASTQARRDVKSVKPLESGTITAGMQAYVKSKLRSDMLCAKSFLRDSPEALRQVLDYVRPCLAAPLKDVARQILLGWAETGTQPPADRRSADFSFDMAVYGVVQRVFEDLNPLAFDAEAVALVREIGLDLQHQIQADQSQNGNSPNDYGDLGEHGAVRFAIERIAFRLLAETLRTDTSTGVDANMCKRLASTFQAATNRKLDFARLGDEYFTRPAPDAEKVLNETGLQAVAPVVAAHAAANAAVFAFFAEMINGAPTARQPEPAVLYS